MRKSNLHFTDVHPVLLSKDSWITNQLWNGAIKRWLMVEEDLPSMKLGVIDFGLFNATQLLEAW